MGTIKADSIQPTIAGNNLILRTGSDVERVRISPTGDINVSGNFVVSVTGNAGFVGNVGVTGNMSVSGRVTSSTGTTASDSASTLTTKSYVDAIFEPSLTSGGTNTTGGHLRFGQLVFQYGFIPLSQMTSSSGNVYGNVTFRVPFTQVYSVTVTPFYTAYNAAGDSFGQAMSLTTTGFLLSLGLASGGNTTYLAGGYWMAIGR